MLRDNLKIEDAIRTTEEIIVHCAISDARSEVPLEERQIEPLIGFDRLRESGLSEEEIANLRERFHQLRQRDAEEIDRNLEETWLDNQQEEDVHVDGVTMDAYAQLFSGLVIGFFGGIISLMWLYWSVFTEYQTIGIIFGFIINVAYGMCNYFN